MRIAPQVELDADQRSRLEAIVRSRKLPARLIERSRIVLLAAAGCRNKQIADELNLTPEKAARWRKRYLQLGLAGLEKDAPRPGRKPRITAKCQGRSKFGPLRRSKSRPVGEGVAVFVGRLERSLRSPFRAAQA